MGVLRCQQEATEALQLFVGLDFFEQTLRKALAAMCFQDIDIGQVGERGLVCDHTGKPDLFVTFKDTESQ